MPTTPAKVLQNKQLVKGLLDKIANEPSGALRGNLAAAYHADAKWRGSHPLNETEGIDGIESLFWAPLMRSFPDLERRDLILVGGETDGRDYVGAVGHYAGLFKQDWLNIPATGGAAYLRYGEMHQVQGGKIIESMVLLDILDVIRQAGLWPLSALRPVSNMGGTGGCMEMWPAPITGDGTELALRDAGESAYSLKITRAMQKALDNDILDREQLQRMYPEDYWHRKMMWYGPCGVGTSRGLEGFVDIHQLPFRLSYPKRDYGKNNYAAFGDGPYSATGGWPAMEVAHEGGRWLHPVPATGRPIDVRVMDFYLIHEGKIRENWVPLDTLYMLHQLGVDVMGNLKV